MESVRQFPLLDQLFVPPPDEFSGFRPIISLNSNQVGGQLPSDYNYWSRIVSSEENLIGTDSRFALLAIDL